MSVYAVQLYVTAYLRVPLERFVPQPADLAKIGMAEGAGVFLVRCSTAVVDASNGHALTLIYKHTH